MADLYMVRMGIKRSAKIATNNMNTRICTNEIRLDFFVEGWSVIVGGTVEQARLLKIHPARAGIAQSVEQLIRNQ